MLELLIKQFIPQGEFSYVLTQNETLIVEHDKLTLLELMLKVNELSRQRNSFELKIEKIDTETNEVLKAEYFTHQHRVLSPSERGEDL